VAAGVDVQSRTGLQTTGKYGRGEGYDSGVPLQLGKRNESYILGETKEEFFLLNALNKEAMRRLLSLYQEEKEYPQKKN
jgi:hypothetical protein